MEHLLPAGSLEAAFEAIRQQPPAESQQILPQQIAATPRVEILARGPVKSFQGTLPACAAGLPCPERESSFKLRSSPTGSWP